MRDVTLTVQLWMAFFRANCVGAYAFGRLLMQVAKGAYLLQLPSRRVWLSQALQEGKYTSFVPWDLDLSNCSIYLLTSLKKIIFFILSLLHRRAKDTN